MNDQLQAFARNELKKNLSKCTTGEKLLFKRMYSHKDLDAHTDKVVDNMPEERLDWAMQQIQRTLDKKEKSNV